MTSTFYEEISVEKFKELQIAFRYKPTKEQVLQEIKKMSYSGTKTMRLINDYFFKDLISKTKLYHSKWCIEDVFEHKPLLEIFYAKIHDNDNVFPKEYSDLKNIETAIRIGGKGIAAKPSNFDLGQTIEIIKKYNTNGNYYDPSCGWGVRMVGSLACGINYYGTDPNYELTARLKELGSMFQEIDLFAPIADIRTQGSEDYIPDFANKMGLIFTSPPYFFLEDYGIGNQSTKLYPKYKDWLEKYYFETLMNCYQYAINGAYMLINIKDYSEYDLEWQTKELAKMAGWAFVGTESFDNIQRISEKSELIDNSETIFVFQKKE